MIFHLHLHKLGIKAQTALQIDSKFFKSLDMDYDVFKSLSAYDVILGANTNLKIDYQ